jgi:hypothetical protein
MTSPRPCSEAARRRDDFLGGRPILLPDDEAWTFYEPTARPQPMATARGRLPRIAPGWSFGAGDAEVDAILSGRFARLIRAWATAGDEPSRAAALLSCAWFLLARNYHITAEEFATLMAGVSAWDEAEHARLAESLFALMGDVCGRAASLIEAEVV